MPIGFSLNKIYSAGYCVGRGFFADPSLGWKKQRFYAQCFLIKHPSKGLILVDTGYGKPLVELTKRWPFSIYKRLLPFTYSNQDNIVYQLEQDGIFLKDISYLLITHFHPDHIGALPQFANVPWIYRKDSLDHLLSLSPLKALKNGFFPQLVPAVPQGSIPVHEVQFNQKWHNFNTLDLFGDQSLYLIDLPGHALGQMGVVLEDGAIVADATWGGEGFPVFGLLVQQHIGHFCKSFRLVQQLRKLVKVYPTHQIEDHEANP